MRRGYSLDRRLPPECEELFGRFLVSAVQLPNAHTEGLKTITPALAAATAAAVFTAASSFGGVVPAKAENLKMAQVGVEIGVGQDRGVREEDRVVRERRRDS